MMTTTTDPWAEYLSLSEWDRMTLVVELTSLWPAGAVEEFERLGLIRETTPLPAMHCSECSSEPAHDIVWIEHPRTGETIAIRPCSQCGPEQIPLEELRRWTIEWPGLVAFLAEGLGVRGEARELVPERLWQLGKVWWSGRPTTLFVGRALHRHDLGSIVAGVSHFKNAVFLVPRRPPTVAIQHPVVTLELVCGWNGQTLDFDAEFVAAQVPPPAAAPRSPKKRGHRTAVREKLRAELDAHVAASRNHVQAAIEFGREPTLLPFPSYEELARRCGTSKATVSRCLKDDPELKGLCSAARDLYRQLHPRC